MCIVVVITDHKNSFITVLPLHTNLENWACTWIETTDNDIEFWNNGNISIDRSANEINIYGDNGMICLSFQFFSV
jgi:hypothetical protein